MSLLRGERCHFIFSYFRLLTQYFLQFSHFMYWVILLSYISILPITMGGQGASTSVLVGMVISTYYGRLSIVSLWSTIEDMHAEDRSELWSYHVTERIWRDGNTIAHTEKG